MMEIKARGAPLLVFALPQTAEIEHIADDLLLPHYLDEFAPIPFSLATQLFA
jgi:hypothetical protein